MSEKKNKNKTMHGRRLDTWKIVLISVAAFFLLLVSSAYIFVNVYVPSVDDDLAFHDDKGILTYLDNNSVRKYRLARVIMEFGRESDRISGIEDTPVYIRNSGVYNFLVLGHDKVALNTDVIMIVNFDTNNGNINVMQLPRDTYIEKGGYGRKINSMFAYHVGEARKNGSKNVYHDALSGLCETLEDAFKIELDNYALVNLEAFKNIVDIIGGVPIDVPEDMDYDDEFQNLSIHIKKGYQVLDGETAMGFVRFRSGYVNADIGRQNAQKLFMTALLSQVQKNFSVGTITKIVEQALKNITTDINLADAIYYAKSALSVDLSNLNMMSLPGEALYANGVSYYIIYRASTYDIVNKYFNVYNLDIPEKAFDSEFVFTSESSDKIHSVYTRTDVDYVVNNGESVSSDGLYIPRLPDVPVVTEAETEAVSEPLADTTEKTESAEVDGEEETSDTEFDEVPESGETVEYESVSEDDTESEDTEEETDRLSEETDSENEETDITEE